MKRISKEDLDKAVVQTKKSKIVDKTGVTPGKYRIEFISEDGLPSTIEDSKTAAKYITDAAGTTTYFVKVNRHADIYHPNNIFYLEASERRAHQEGTDPYRLLSVPKNCFDLYTKFLITKNTVFLAAAQKAMSQ